MRPVPVEALLGHSNFVRAVVRSLLADENLVDDAVQETWIAALERPPRQAASQRSWLKTVARRTAIKALRAERRRHAREESCARNEKSPPAAESAERNELLEQVTRAALSIDEPYRETLLLRYYDGLTPAQIALRTDTPVKTVYSRIARGLSILKERLDDAYGGERSAWAVALFGLLEGRRRGVDPTGQQASWASKAVLGGAPQVAAGMLAIAAIAFGVVSTSRDAAVEPATSELRGLAPPPALTDLTTPRPIPPPSTGQAVPDRQEIPSTSPIESASAALTLVVLREHTREPLVDRSFTIRPSNGETPIERRTNGAGRIELSLDPGPVRFDDGLGGGGTVELVGGRRVVHEHVVPRGYDVAGRVSLAGGEPVAEASVWLCPRAVGEPGHVVAVTNDEGAFHLADVDATWRIGASAPGAGASRLQDLEGIPGQELAVQIELPGRGGNLEGVVVDVLGAPLEGIEVDWSAGPDAGFLLFLGTLTAIEAGYHRADGRFMSGRVRPRARTDERGRFRLEGLTVGTGMLRARGPGWADTHLQRVVTNGETEEVRLTMEFGATVEGTVTDAGGHPVSGAKVEVGRPHDARYLLTRSNDEGRFLLEHVPAGTHTLSASRPDLGRAEEPLRIEDETSVRWDPALVEERSVRGVVIDEAGVPLSGWTVRVARREGDMLWNWTRPCIATTDESGHFRLVGCPAGAFDIDVAAQDDRFRTVHRAEAVRAGEDVRIVVPTDEQPSAVLRGRIVGPNGDGLAARLAAIHVRDKAFWDGGAPFWARGGSDPDTGAFELDGVRPGPYALMVDDATRPAFWVQGIQVEPGSVVDIGTVQVRRPGSLRLVGTGPITPYEYFSIHDVADQAQIVHIHDPGSNDEVLLIPGTYGFELHGWGVPVTRTFEIRSDEVTVLEVTPRTALPYQLEVVWRSSTELPVHVICTAREAEGAVVRAWESHMTTPSFLLDVSLPAGSYVVEAQASTGESAVVDVVVRPEARQGARVVIPLR